MAELQELVDALADRLGRPVAIEDHRYRVLAYSAHDEPLDRVRLTSILTRAAPPDLAAWLDARGLREAAAPVRLAPPPALGMGPRVAVPIRDGGRPLGFVWVIDEAIGEPELAAAVATAEAAAPAVRRAREAARGEAALVRDLLHGAGAERTAAARALRDRGLRGPVRVLVGAGLERLRSVAPRRLALGESVAVLAGDAGVLRALELPAGAGAIGVSGPRERLEDAPGALAEAEQAARLPGRGPVVRWEGLGSDQLLAQLAGAPLPEPLRRLLAHPEGEALAATLESFLDRAGDVPAAAAALFVHRTTLYQRLRRVERIAGVDLRDGDDRLLLHMGLRLRRLNHGDA